MVRTHFATRPRNNDAMRRFLISAALASVAVASAACGSSTSGGSSGTTKIAAGAGAGVDTVAVGSAAGLGQILIDSNGRALYSSDQESSGRVFCVNKCAGVWIPLSPGATAPTAGAGVPAIAVIDRPDGLKQVTAAGRPLYTFAADAPGKITGDGLADDFGTQHFTWHTVLSDGTLSAAVSKAPSAPAGYGGD